MGFSEREKDRGFFLPADMSSPSLISLFPVATFEPVSLEMANSLLGRWSHKMGPCVRGNARGWSHALFHEGEPVAVTVTATLIMPCVGGGNRHLTRENTIELARLCASRPGLCRVALRLWREFVLPSLPYRHAISYQDADLHNGNTYRFDGWERIGALARSGPDTRTKRPGRNKWVWIFPPSTATGEAKGGE